MQPRHSIRGGKDYNPSPQSFASRDRTEAIPTSVSNRPAHRWRHRIFVGYVALMMLVFLVPVPAAPLAESNHVDKLVHFTVFLGFALLYHIDHTSRAGWTFLISFAFAAGIELAQWGLPYREGDWWDFVVGAAGATVGTVLMLLIERQAQRVAEGRRRPA
jgi:VanZ family protein